MKLSLFALLLFFLSIAYTQDPSYEKGYAVIRGEKVEGNIKINVEGGSISIKQEGINKVYLLDIDRVVIQTEGGELHYVTKEVEGKSAFYKLLVDGNIQLLEKNSELVASRDQDVIILDSEKIIMDVLKEEKKEIKDYIFVRNVSIAEKEGIVEVFEYYNTTLGGS